MSIRLNDGDRVCIIGGGPAGSFAALHLLKKIDQLGMRLEVIIFEPRNFFLPGPGGCNRCAGIISSRLVSDLKSLDISLPSDVVQSEIRGYSVHLNNETVRIDQPGPDYRIVSIYRGGGPRLHQDGPVSSFDGYLLAEACARGAEQIQARAISVTWDEKPIVHTAQDQFAADLVILATGVNSRPPLGSEFGYQPPKTEIMAQDEFLLPEGWASDQVSSYFQKPPGLVFGALIPKGSYLNISLLGRGLATDAISDFLEAHELSQDLSISKGSLCGCTPRIAVGSAKRYFGDRWVAVGDAAVSRLYKDGIGSAFVTAEKAIDTVLKFGISEGSFRKEYNLLCQKIKNDNNYGRFLFRLWGWTLRLPILVSAWVAIIQSEEELQRSQRIHSRILWGMFTGGEPYRDLFKRLFRLESIIPLYRSYRRERRKLNVQDHE
jgi:flavin-dependent dehydrogenase